MLSVIEAAVKSYLVAQALEKPTVQSNLRSMSFKDQFGNPISTAQYLELKARTDRSS